MLVVSEEETSKTRRRIIAIMTTRIRSIRMDVNLAPNNNQGGEIGVACVDALIEI
jgi:hypothetical protein